MGKVLPEIGSAEAAFIEKQKIFFVGTAPLKSTHHVNVSPKGGTVAILDHLTVMYADLTGSGAETAAHVLETSRMTLMFCNIEAGLPKILRLFGQAELMLAENVPYDLLNRLPKDIVENPGFRAVYKLKVRRISSSCGYSLPIFEFKKNRKTLQEWSDKQGKSGMFDYVTEKNSFSVDGLPSLGLMRRDAPPTKAVPTNGYIYGQPTTVAHSFKRAVSVPTIIWTRNELAVAGVSLFILGLVTGIAAISFTGS